MSYLEKLREKILGRREDSREELVAQSLTAERLEDIVMNGSFQVLIDEILDPMQKESYELFLKMSPKDSDSVYQAQKLGQVVDQIKKRVERKIELGRFARVRLAELSTEE